MSFALRSWAITYLLANLTRNAKKTTQVKSIGDKDTKTTLCIK